MENEGVIQIYAGSLVQWACLVPAGTVCFVSGGITGRVLPGLQETASLD